MSEKLANSLEKKIRGLMSQIKIGKLKPEDSGIGKLFAGLKTIDEATWETLINEYKTIIINYNTNQKKS